jgi:hypothetical protein
VILAGTWAPAGEAAAAPERPAPAAAAHAARSLNIFKVLLCLPR